MRISKKHQKRFKEELGIDEQVAFRMARILEVLLEEYPSRMWRGDGVLCTVSDFNGAIWVYPENFEAQPGEQGSGRVVKALDIESVPNLNGVFVRPYKGFTRQPRVEILGVRMDPETSLPVLEEWRWELG